MVKPEFTLFQMQMKALFSQPSEPGQPGFGIAPEAFYPIDMTLLISKFILGVVHPQMLLIPDVHKAVVASPAIRMDDALQIDTASNDCLERGAAAIRNDLGVYPALPFKDSENDGLAARAASAHSLNAPWAEIAFIELDDPEDRRLLFTKLGYPLTDGQEVPVHSIAV